MNDEWMILLRQRCREIGVAGCARELGYSRSAVSMARDGKYPAGVGKLRAAVIKTYTRCECPHLGMEISSAQCRRYRARPLPQSNSEALRFWAACDRCPIGRRLAEAEKTAGSGKESA